MAIRQANSVQEQAPATNAAEETVAVETTTQVADPVVETAAEPVNTQASEPEVEKEPVQTQAEDRSAASESVLEEDEDEPVATQTQAAAAPASTSTAVAEASAAKAVAVPVHKNSLMEQIKADLAEQGFENVELDYSSFLNVTLNKQIETSEGQELPNSGFLVRLASSRLKYCFRNNNPVEDEVEVAYSYDANAHKDPESEVSAKIKKWQDEGLELGDIKIYTEVLAVMLDDKVEGEAAGELNGKLITIQVAPTSKGRYAGYLAQLGLQGIKEISSVKTLVRRGKKVESGKFPFYPWDFVNKGKIEAPAE